MFEIESMVSFTNYQLDLRTPGSIPSLANSLKQIRQMPKSRIKAFPRPQRKHLFFCRVENLGFFKALAFTDVLAINKISPYVDDIVYFFLKSRRNILIDLKEKHRSSHF
ncbi:hypothetical protein A2W67_01565 [Candidatus Nomurabacteria bacterium RIFCSPLOWO2_02_40_28]|nr:MAG: hypothetical protein A2W67_01565 [Candidatus Nomurabacteria bacterium RIFCSPLOWO2_02_40_28]